jgi:RNA polymerase sigma-70 factor (ECF subfamily)
MGGRDTGDVEARFVSQLTETQLQLQCYVRSLLPGDPAAADVSQQANATIWEKRSDFQPGTNFKAWAFTIARYEVLSHRKRQARHSRLQFSGDLDEQLAEEILTDERGVQEQHEALQRCLAKLRDRDRELLLYRYAEKGTLAEFAQSMGRSVGGLKVTLHRLRNALLACMQRGRMGEEVV